MHPAIYAGFGAVATTRTPLVDNQRHCLLVQCVCQQCTGTAADHVRTGLRKGSTCLNMGISRGLKVAQLLAGFPDGITLYIDRPFIPREYQCFSWLGTARPVYLCNLRVCGLLHRDDYEINFTLPPCFVSVYFKSRV